MKYRLDLLAGLFGVALLAMPMAAAAQNNDTNKENSRPSASQPRESSQSRESSQPKAAPERSHEEQGHANAMTGSPNEARHTEANASANESREQKAPQRTEATNENRQAPENMNRGEHNARGNNAGVAENNNVEHRDYGNDHGDSHHDGDHDRGGVTYAYGPEVYVMPQGYAGGPCAWARHLRLIYDQDRETGHPAAADDLLPQLRRAERACG